MHSSRMRTARGSASVHAGIPPPPGVGPETPQARPLNSPPPVWAWKPARHAEIPPPPETCCKAEPQTRVKHNLAPTSLRAVITCHLEPVFCGYPVERSLPF